MFMNAFKKPTNNGNKPKRETKTQHQVKAAAGLLQMQTEVTDITHLKQNMDSKGRVRHQDHIFKQCGLSGFKRE